MTDLIIPRFTWLSDIPKCDHELINYQPLFMFSYRNKLAGLCCHDGRMQTIVDSMNQVLSINAVCDWGADGIYINHKGNMELAGILLEVMIGDIPDVKFTRTFLRIKL